MKKITSKIRVKNELGIHTRPATCIVKLLQNCKSDVRFTHRRETVNAKSILSILMLALHKNTHLTITVEGDDAEDTMAKLMRAFDTNFGEQPSCKRSIDTNFRAQSACKKASDANLGEQSACKNAKK